MNNVVKSWHVQMKIATALSMTNKQLKSMFECDPVVAREEFKQQMAMGRIYLHTEGCDNEDAEGKCLGHAVSEDVPWTDGPAPEPTVADYYELQKLYDAIQTQLFNEKAKHHQLITDHTEKLIKAIMTIPVPEYGRLHNVKMRNVIINIMRHAAEIRKP
jgi:hypothetical protein